MSPEMQELFQNLWTITLTRLPEFLLRLLGVVAVLFIGRWLARYLGALSTRLLQRYQIDDALLSFLSKAIYVVTLIVALVVALSILGIATSPIVAILGAATLAIGLALRDSLANLAAGLQLLVLKPFIAGDYVKLGSKQEEGTIISVQFFHTELRTGDNRVLFVPNSDVMSNSILNFTRSDSRRIDLVIPIDYAEDTRRAKALIGEAIAAERRVLPEPAPRVAVQEFGAAGVNLMARAYVATADHDATRADLMEQIKLHFDEAGIVIAQPQRIMAVADASANAQSKPGKDDWPL